MESLAPTQLAGSSPDEMFPVLTADQQARALAHGSLRKVVPGETLVELNQQPTRGLCRCCRQTRTVSYQ
jgi:hypothetical protein